MRIIGLTGSHGTGKTTILDDVRSDVLVDDSKISRTVQEQLGWDNLKRVENSILEMWTFQRAVIDALMIRDYNLHIKRGGSVLVDRTPVDCQAYTKLWCDRFKLDWKKDKRIQSYFKLCSVFYKNFYHNIIYIPISDQIAFKAESNRADLESRNIVDQYILSFLHEEKIPYVTLTTTNRKDRANYVKEIINDLSKNT